MRTLRHATVTTLLGGALLLPSHGATLAQDAETVYTDGAAQLLVRVGEPSMNTFSLVYGEQDATAGTMTLSFLGADGEATLSLLTPNVAGSHAAEPKPPRGAAVTYRKVQGRSGARAACTVTWGDLSPTMVSGSFLCPRERMPTGRKARYAVTGTFVARVAPEDGVSTPGLPIHPAGTPVEVAGQTLTVTGVTDLAAVCVAGTAKGADRGECPEKRLPVPGTFRAIAMTACVADESEAMRLLDRKGTSRILFGGTPEAVMPIGLPVAVADPAVTTRGLPRTVNPGSCLDGHLVAGTQGPLVVWTPPNGEPAVGWTLDPVALPPTAETPVVEPSGAPASPAPVATFPPAASVTYAGGAADVLHDGAELLAADDLVLTEGTYLSDGAGVTLLHLAFASASGSLTIDVPGTDGTYAWEAGAAIANEGMGYTIGAVVMDAGLTGCQVDVVPTGSGGVEGTWLCTLPTGGTGSGAFIANP